jgi:hypothetical protein
VLGKNSKKYNKMDRSDGIQRDQAIIFQLSELSHSSSIKLRKVA